MLRFCQLEWAQTPPKARPSMIGITTLLVCSFIDYYANRLFEGAAEWWYHPLQKNLIEGVDYGKRRPVETQSS